MRAQKSCMLFFVFVLSVLLFSNVADAYTVTVYGGSYQNGSGGEFTLTGASDFVGYYKSGVTSNLVYNNSFQTFCLETDEHLVFGNSYQANVSSSAYLGGSGGPEPDPISKGTASLYLQFAKGTLSGYNYGSGRNDSAGLLQKAIWYLEEESSSFTGYSSNTEAFNNNIFLQAVVGTDTTTNWGIAKSDNSGTYNVAVLNLTNPTNSDGVSATSPLRQDVLVVTPIPPALLLLGPALIGLVGFRKRIFG
jgi:hypothetical protein